MRQSRKLLLAMLTAGAMMLGTMPAAHGAQLPSNCTKDRGTVTCTTFEGPGKNQAGVGTTTNTDTQGNTTNTSPEPQDLGTTETCKPPTSQGTPCNP
jgi:hypothetical protein